MSSDTKQLNEAREVEFLRSDAPKNLHGLSLRSSDSLYRRMQSSTPCAMLAKSRDSTFSSRYSRSSGGRETVSDFFLIALDIEVKRLWLLINSLKNVTLTSSNLLEGASKHEQKQPISGSSAERNGTCIRSYNGRHLVDRSKDGGWEGPLHDRPDIVRDLGAYGRLQIGRHQESVQGVLSGRRGSLLKESNKEVVT